jgi:hypothetical protein
MLLHIAGWLNLARDAESRNSQNTRLNERAANGDGPPRCCGN